MSTRATIGYQTDDGGYVGVYLHFDGNPSNIIPILKRMGYCLVKTEVERALLQCGFRSLNDNETYFDYRGEVSERHVWLKSTWPCKEEEYNYRVKKNGDIECIDYKGNCV